MHGPGKITKKVCPTFPIAAAISLKDLLFTFTPLGLMDYIPAIPTP